MPTHIKSGNSVRLLYLRRMHTICVRPSNITFIKGHFFTWSGRWLFKFGTIVTMCEQLKRVVCWSVGVNGQTS